MLRTRIRIHPCEVLRQAFMIPLHIGADALAMDLHVSPRRVLAILAIEKPRPVSADMARRLSRQFGTTPAFWLNLQTAHDGQRVIA